MRAILAASLLLLASACSKPTELASEANAVGGNPAAAPPVGAPLPDVSVPPEIAAPELSTPAEPAQADGLVDDEVRASFPDYQPKTTPDTVVDFRPGVSGDIGALPGDAAGLAQAFVEWKAKATASPGAFEPGAQQLGADAEEYVPSDAELVAAEAGKRLAGLLSGGDAATREVVDAVLGPDPAARSYKRFDFRHVDVLGSGRFFYASPPKDASIPAA
jgi:hypothetical protein